MVKLFKRQLETKKTQRLSSTNVTLFLLLWIYSYSPHLIFGTNFSWMLLEYGKSNFTENNLLAFITSSPFLVLWNFKNQSKVSPVNLLLIVPLYVRLFYLNQIRCILTSFRFVKILLCTVLKINKNDTESFFICEFFVCYLLFVNTYLRWKNRLNYLNIWITFSGLRGFIKRWFSECKIDKQNSS